MRHSAVLLMPVLALVASCGGGSGESAPTAAVSQPVVSVETPTDNEIIGKIYDPYYSVPTGFFVDERAGMSQSYTVHHVMDDSQSFEVCTDDFDTAADWEATDNDARSVRGYYVGAHENDRYFEFIRELSYSDDVGNVGDLTSPGFARVFKCSNTERDGVDRSLLSGYAGRLNARPLNAPAVREFAEYFWQFTFFPQRYRKVLDSYDSSTSDAPAQTLLLGFASSQGTGRCDRIEVVEWRFVAAPSTGDISSNFRTLRSFAATLTDGSPSLCQ
ncbi:MAG: hypothetical protein QNJ00_18170 [Woeseiaceae bacterium]|nr:hypothetical protein [Woeseiaceae bacterium]